MNESNPETPSYQELLEENQRLRQENAELKRVLAFDELTGFYKEEAAKHKAQQIIGSYFIESTQPLAVSLILMDLDRLSRFNDYSHNVGNEAIRRFGKFIRQDIIELLKRRNYPTQGLGEPFFAFRSFDRGDEFGLVLCGVDKEEAEKIAADLQDIDIAFVFSHKGEKKTDWIQFSVGVSSTADPEIVRIKSQSDLNLDTKAKAAYDVLKKKASEAERANKKRGRKNG
ncbi:MAG: GGDEF domain-containing protein [Patescibacteria group bacterium]